MKLIPLTQGKFAQVDDADFEWLSQWRWRYDNGYASRGTARRDGNRKIYLHIYMHREILKTPPGAQTDHVDMDKLNNQRSNLRACTPSQNNLNRGLRINNVSGFRGVSWSKANKKWVAQIQEGGKKINIGYFHTAEGAAHAYDRAALKCHGEFAKLNLPPEEQI